MWRWLRTRNERGVDVAIAVAYGAVLVTVIANGREDHSTEPDALAYAIGVVMAGLQLERRRRPLQVLLVTTGFVELYYALGYPAFGFAIPVGLAVYTASVAGHARWSVAVVTTFFVQGILFRSLVEGDDLARVFDLDVFTETSLLGTAILLGETVRSRRRLEEETRARIELAEAEREREAERRVQEERRRVARDVHDVLAHTVAAITVQAGVASDALRDSPDEAEAALAAIRAQSREALAELRATVTLLREDGDVASTAPQPGLAQIEDLVDMAAAAGVHVAVEIDGSPRPLPAVVDLTAYRIVQESLTNVVRHAATGSATVAIRFEPAAVTVEIADRGASTRAAVAANGAPAERDSAPSVGAGFGITGMRERAAAIGGELDAGPGRSGGFRVRARLPTGGMIA